MERGGKHTTYLGALVLEEDVTYGEETHHAQEGDSVHGGEWLLIAPHHQICSRSSEEDEQEAETNRTKVKSNDT